MSKRPADVEGESPDQKKQKISHSDEVATTTESTDTPAKETTVAENPTAQASPSWDEDGFVPTVRKLPKIKVALLIGFCGLGYQGMQINPGANTIEKHLQKALYRAGSIDPRNMERIQKIAWMRCARTDKGVHAIGQIVSVKLKFNDEVMADANSHLPEDIRIFGFVRVTGGFNSKRDCSSRTYQYILRTEILRPSPKHPDWDKHEEWTYGPAEQERFRDMIKRYEGTHSFHNFTKGGSASMASCQRFIMSMDLSEPFTTDGMEFVRITLQGQSFILHQIRKMVGTAAVIFRDGASPELLDKFMGPIEMALPMAPGLGLLLLECHFKYYQKFKGKAREPLTFLDCVEAQHKFREEVIDKAIYTKEKEENTTMEWVKKWEEEDGGLQYDSPLLTGQEVAAKEEPAKEPQPTEA